MHSGDVGGALSSGQSLGLVWHLCARHWRHVAEASGQSFNDDFLQRDDFIYDSEPASRAVITMMRIDSARALDFMTHLQAAFYTANRDITDAAELMLLAQQFGLDADQFKTKFEQDESARITSLSFAYTRHLKISGFPALIGQSAGEHCVITRGYQAFNNIDNNIRQWLATS